MNDLLVHSISLFEFDRDNATKYHGVLAATDLQEAAGVQTICRRLVSKLWGKSLNHITTYDLVFQNSAVNNGIWVTRAALTDLANGVNVGDASQCLAQALSQSGHAHRYALVLIGFTYKTTNLAALILTKSATNDTFAVPDVAQITPGSDLLHELHNIYAKDIEKGLLYPFYDSDEESVHANKCKVFQRGDFSDYFPKHLGLEIKPSPTSLVASVVPQAIVLADQWSGIDQFATNLIALAHDTNVSVSPEDARVHVQVDSVEVNLKLKEATSGALHFDHQDGIYSLTIKGRNLVARIGDTELPFSVLRTEGE